MLRLKTKPTMQEFQKYVNKMERERGFTNQDTIQRCLHLGEEVGELFKAVRMREKMKIDKASRIKTADHEIADIFIHLCSIANRLKVDVEKAFREKEEINKERVWK